MSTASAGSASDCNPSTTSNELQSRYCGLIFSAQTAATINNPVCGENKQEYSLFKEMLSTGESSFYTGFTINSLA